MMTNSSIGCLINQSLWYCDLACYGPRGGRVGNRKYATLPHLIPQDWEVGHSNDRYIVFGRHSCFVIMRLQVVYQLSGSQVDGHTTGIQQSSHLPCPLA